MKKPYINPTNLTLAEALPFKTGPAPLLSGFLFRVKQVDYQRHEPGTDHAHNDRCPQCSELLTPEGIPGVGEKSVHKRHTARLQAAP